MLICDDPPFLFVSQPKCATHTFFSILAAAFGGVRVNPPKYHCRVKPERAADYFCWTICRNPFARVVGLWKYGEERGYTKGYPYLYGHFESFVRWMAGPHKRPQDWPVPMHLWHAGLRIDRVLHLEDIEAEVLTLPFWRPGIQIPRLAVSKHGPWRSYMTPEMVDLILRWSDGEHEVYGYDRNDWQP